MSVDIFENPLTEEEYTKHSMDRLILKTPSRYHLVDCLKELKWGRPSESQKQIEDFIQFLLLDDNLGKPFSSDIVNGAWEKGQEDKDTPANQ